MDFEPSTVRDEGWDMTRWTRYQVPEGTDSLEQVLESCGHLFASGAVLEETWTLPENPFEREGRERYALRPGETIFVPLPEEVTVCVAPSRDSIELPATVRSRIRRRDASFSERLEHFRLSLREDVRPEDAYRSCFPPLVISDELEAMVVEGLVSTTYGQEAGVEFTNWLLDNGYADEALTSSTAEGSFSGEVADSFDSAASVWAEYPSDLSAYSAFFLRGEYIRRVTRVIDPAWRTMSYERLGVELTRRYTAEEIEIIFRQLSERRSAIKARIRGYGYVNAIAVALVWAADDIERGDWTTVAWKGGGLLAGTWAFNRLLYARDSDAARILARASGVTGVARRTLYGRWLSGIARTNRTVNRFVRGPWLMVLSGFDTSPHAAESSPLDPRTRQDQTAIDDVRARLGIPEGVLIDRHGHRHSRLYLQTAPDDLVHSESCLIEETEEILWWLGVPITYRHGETVWTVPGRRWGS